MPIYSLTNVKALAATGKFDLANSRARTKVQALGWKIATVKAFLLKLDQRHFHASYMGMSIYDGRGMADVDAYKMCFDEYALCEGKTGVDSFFFTKLAIVTPTAGQAVAVVSFHLDGAP